MSDIKQLVISHDSIFTTLTIELLKAIGSEDLMSARSKAITEQSVERVEREGKLLGGRMVITVEFNGKKSIHRPLLGVG